MTLQVVRAAINGIEFPCVDFKTAQENSSVPHRAYRVPGADVEHTGRGPKKIVLRAAFLNGMITGGWPELYPSVRDRIEQIFLESPDCTLTHPYYGRVSVHFDKFDEAIDQNTQQGVFVEIELTETNASAQLYVHAAVPQEPASAMTDAATAADEAVAAITDKLAPLVPVVETQLAYLDDDTRDSAQAYGALAEVQTAAQALLDAPTLAGIAGHDARASVREVITQSWAFAERYLTPKPQSRTYVTPAPMSLTRAAAQIYGDASKTALLRRANALADEMRIPAGTTLKVPDDA